MEISAQGGRMCLRFRRLQQLCVGALGQIYRAVIQSSVHQKPPLELSRRTLLTIPRRFAL